LISVCIARQAKRARLTPADLPHIGELTRLWWLGLTPPE